MDLVSVKSAPEMTCSRIYIANSLVTGKGNMPIRDYFTGAEREFQPIYSYRLFPSTFCEMRVMICGRFYLDESVVVGYNNQLLSKYVAKLARRL